MIGLNNYPLFERLCVNVLMARTVIRGKGADDKIIRIHQDNALVCRETVFWQNQFSLPLAPMCV